MFDVYELYGLRVADLRDVRSLLSHALGVAFECHDSYYLGEYFLASWPSGRKLTIESNQLEDEDGKYSQEAEFSEYKTLVRLEYRAPSRLDDGPAPDELSSRLGNLEGLILLPRNSVAAVTEWNMARVLLAMVPETAPLIAKAAAEAYDIDPEGPVIPARPGPDQIRQGTTAERLAHPHHQALDILIGQNLRADFGTYAVAGWMFLPVFEMALEADQVDEDLVRRCCAFLETALAGDELVAEGIRMMVAENFGVEHTAQVLPKCCPMPARCSARPSGHGNGSTESRCDTGAVQKVTPHHNRDSGQGKRDRTCRT